MKTRSRSKNTKTRRTKRQGLKKTTIETLMQKVRSRGVSPSCDSCGDDRCSD